MTLPSGLFWDFTVDNLADAGLRSGLKLVCGGAMTQRAGNIIHPYGAKGEYTVNEISHGRTQIPYTFVNGAGTGGGSCIGENVRTQRSYDTISLTQKKLTGPGLSPMTWNYTYSQTQGGWTSSTGVSEVNTTSVVDPEGNKVVHHFNRNYNWEDGAEEKIEIFDGTTTLLRTIENTYEVGPMLGGAIATSDNDKPARYPRSVERRVITENGDTYTTDYEYQYASTCYDHANSNTCYGYGRPTEVSESNSVNAFTKTTKNYLFTEQDDWMLALPKKTMVGTETLTEIDYNADYLPDSIEEYGVVVATRFYLNTGQIDWEENALSHRYTFSNYYRGMPETITYPDSMTRLFEIDYFGNVTKSTDRKGYSTNYEYDNMDRLTLINYPDETGSTRDNKTLAYSLVTTTDINQTGSGLVTNQWKVEKTRGEFKSTSYLDAMLRSVLAKTEDTTDSTLTRFGKSVYTSKKRIFQSFPSGDALAADGTDSSFDGLGRIVETEENVTPFAKTAFISTSACYGFIATSVTTQLSL